MQECYNFLKVAVFRLLHRTFHDSPKVLELLKRSQDPTHVHDHRLLTEIGKQVRAIDVREAVRFFRVINALSPKLILNRVHDFREIREGLSLQIATQDLLRLRLEVWGYLSYDPRLQHALRAKRPEDILPADSENYFRLVKMVQRHLLGANVRYEALGARTIVPLLDLHQREASDGRICSVQCPLWGNCELEEGGLPCRMQDAVYENRISELSRSSVRDFFEE